MGTIVGTIEVCQCCMLCHANGECCPDDHDTEPLSLIGEGYSVTLGLVESEHRDSGRCTPEDRAVGNCDCDQLGFSWQRCEGCGSPLGGDRYALTLWREV